LIIPIKISATTNVIRKFGLIAFLIASATFTVLPFPKLKLFFNRLNNFN